MQWLLLQWFFSSSENNIKAGGHKYIFCDRVCNQTIHQQPSPWIKTQDKSLDDKWISASGYFSWCVTCKCSCWWSLKKNMAITYVLRWSFLSCYPVCLVISEGRFIFFQRTNPNIAIVSQDNRGSTGKVKKVSFAPLNQWWWNLNKSSFPELKKSISKLFGKHIHMRYALLSRSLSPLWNNKCNSTLFNVPTLTYCW